MPELTNKVISKVIKGKSGQNDKGPWTVYNFYLEGGKLKFGYFYTEEGVIPEKGMKVLYMKYKTEEKNGYTNHTVKTLSLEDGSANPISNNSSQGDTKTGLYINHGEVLVRLLEMAKGHQPAFLDLIDVFQRGVKVMSGEEGTKPEWEQEPSSGNPPVSDDDIPF